MKIDYYKVSMPGVRLMTLSGLLGRCQRMGEDDPERRIRVGGKVVRFRCAEEKRGFWRGEFVGIKMEEPAKRASLEGDLEAIALRDNEGLGSETAFLYSPIHDVLALQRNRSGATASALSTFFGSFGEIGGRFELLHIPTRDALDRYFNLRTIRKFEIKLARAWDSEHVREAGLSSSEILDLGRELDCADMRIQVGVGRSWKTRNLRFAYAREFLRQFIRLEDPEYKLEKLIVSGSTPDDERDIVDLAVERLKSQATVTIDEGRNVSYIQRVHALEEDFNTHRADLDSLARDLE